MTDRTQRVRVGPHFSTALSTSTGSPQGCVLSPLLNTQYTHDCSPTHHSNTVVKSADDTTVVGLISGGDESAYQAQVEHLMTWCRVNNLLLKTSKTKELIVDFRNKKTDIQPLHISGECVERVTDFRFLGVHISEDLTWGTNTAELVKKAQQRLNFLRILKRHNSPQKLLVSFYRCLIESILTYCFCVWFASCTVAQKKALQRVIKVAEKVIGCPLTPMEELPSSRCLRKALAISQDSSQPGHNLFQLLPSGRRHRVLKTRTNRLKNSFYPTAMVALNNCQKVNNSLTFYFH